MELTPQEREIIRDLRAKEAMNANRKKRASNVLRVASQYNGWLLDNGRSSTFSTFVDEFGYDADGAAKMFKMASNVINEAWRQTA